LLIVNCQLFWRFSLQRLHLRRKVQILPPIWPIQNEVNVMKLGIAADHGGFQLKESIKQMLTASGHEVIDFGAYVLDNGDDYPDFVVPLAQAVASGACQRGVAICGSGVGASIAANKVTGVRAALVVDGFSAHQGVEDDDMNLICLGGRVVGNKLAEELISSFLNASYIGGERHRRRLDKVSKLERTR
jgi:ribose 5-phosphate isomerase B